MLIIPLQFDISFTVCLVHLEKTTDKNLVEKGTCSSRRFSPLNYLVTALNACFHLSSTHRYFVFNEKAGEKLRGQSSGRSQTIMTDGTVNMLSGAVTQMDYIDI